MGNELFGDVKKVFNDTVVSVIRLSRQYLFSTTSKEAKIIAPFVTSGESFV